MTQHDIIQIAGHQFITVGGLSRLFQLHKRTIQLWAAERDIPVIRIGNLLIFDTDDLKNWLLEHKHKRVE
jgi:excisionase family DNA binding protein